VISHKSNNFCKWKIFDGSAELSVCSLYGAEKDVWSPGEKMATERDGQGMAMYKGLFVAHHDLHNYKPKPKPAFRDAGFGD
jgi:hypothetical protein